jgi:hypothetical protein
VRSTRILTAAALTATGLVLSAGAAAAQTATVPNPDIKSYPTGPTCGAGKLTGSVRVGAIASTLPKGAIPKAVVQLRWNAGGNAYTDTSVLSTQTFNLTAGTSDYAFSLDTSALPATAKSVMAYTIAYPNGTSASSDTLASRVLASSFCGTETAVTTTVSSVTIDCIGDVVNGAAALSDPPTSSIPGQLALQGRPAGGTTWANLGSKNVTVAAGTTSLPYDFSIAGKHAGEYRAFAKVNNGTIKYSEVVTDATCAPPAEVPEAPAALLLPLTMAAGAGVVVAVRRRRTSTSAVSA